MALPGATRSSSTRPPATLFVAMDKESDRALVAWQIEQERAGSPSKIETLSLVMCKTTFCDDRLVGFDLTDC
jgi:hypothetical protein